MVSLYLTHMESIPNSTPSIPAEPPTFSPSISELEVMDGRRSTENGSYGTWITPSEIFTRRLGESLLVQPCHLAKKDLSGLAGAKERLDGVRALAKGELFHRSRARDRVEKGYRAARTPVSSREVNGLPFPDAEWQKRSDPAYELLSGVKGSWEQLPPEEESCANRLERLVDEQAQSPFTQGDPTDAGSDQAVDRHAGTWDQDASDGESWTDRLEHPHPGQDFQLFESDPHDEDFDQAAEPDLQTRDISSRTETPFASYPHDEHIDQAVESPFPFLDISSQTERRRVDSLFSRVPSIGDLFGPGVSSVEPLAHWEIVDLRTGRKVY